MPSRTRTKTTHQSPRPQTAALAGDPVVLDLLVYPDPRLRKRALEVGEFDPATAARLRTLAERMLAVMRQHKGVGLAAPQVGLSVRLFVMNATGEPDGDRIYINPVLTDAEGEEEREEGCLSLPEINTPVWRSLRLRMRARGVDGQEIDEVQEGLVARIWQHETDHLDGVLILDRMPATVKMSHRRKLKELEDAYREAHPQPETAKTRRAGRRK